MCCSRTDALLRGCRLRRRIYDPDDVILGVVDGTVTSRDTAYYSPSRDLHATAGRNRRTRSDPSTRRNGRNSSSSLVRVDSGLADESATRSIASPSSTDDGREELIVPPAPVISLDFPFDTFGMNANATGFVRTNVSRVADERVTNGDETENHQVNGSFSGWTRMRKKKKKSKKTGVCICSHIMLLFRAAVSVLSWTLLSCSTILHCCT